MQHFHAGNRDKIKDAPPNTLATVHYRDVVTMSELARCGFHLIDIKAGPWSTGGRARWRLEATAAPAI
jgi:hypothetical protein